MNTSTAVAIFSCALVLANASLAQSPPQGSAGFEGQAEAPEVNVDRPYRADTVEQHRGLLAPTFQRLTFTFSTYAPRSLHWDAPSNMNIHSDGTWFIYSKHMANMRRTGGFFDTGGLRTAYVNVAYYDGRLNAQGHCTGTLIHSREYPFITLDYKEERWDVTSRGTDAVVASLGNRIQCGVATRRWS
ncbi:MAG: hypothetical protein ACK5RK_15500 [Betaproteobacteria bacterium]